MFASLPSCSKTGREWATARRSLPQHCPAPVPPWCCSVLMALFRLKRLNHCGRYNWQHSSTTSTPTRHSVHFSSLLLNERWLSRSRFLKKVILPHSPLLNERQVCFRKGRSTYRYAFTSYEREDWSTILNTILQTQAFEERSIVCG